MPRPLQELLSEDLRGLAALDRLLDLVLGRRRLDDPQLPLDAVAVLVLVLGLYLLVLGHQVDELARHRAVHVRPYPRLARALVALRELFVLEVHRLELVTHRLRGAVGLLHEALEAVGALALLLRGDGSEALAVALLDQPDVVLDRLHALLDGVHLLEEARHRGRLRRRRHAGLDVRAGAGHAHLELGEPVIHLSLVLQTLPAPATRRRRGRCSWIAAASGGGAGARTSVVANRCKFGASHADDIDA